ncbi:MAG TPA: FtsX-like permease family protein [Ignavibacteriaceae bacterium]|nr:FtsX-like permease family protein [Ignavibacteriaceae bacterium]
MLLSLAWRNIWRNKRRSMIIIAAIAVGLLCGLFASAVMFGMGDSLINTTIDRDLGHIQLHTKTFIDDKLLTDTIPAAPKILSEIKTQPNVTGASARIIIEGMISSATSSGGVRITGIAPNDEKYVTTIHNQIVTGSYFENDEANQILLGYKLAENLGIRERSRVVLSFQGLDGSIIYGAFRVTGIFRTESTMFDRSTVFIRENDLLTLLDSDPIYHEIAIRLNSVQNVDSLYVDLQILYNFLSVQNWKELAPELKLMDEMMGLMMNIFLGVILFALLFGITNTMLMSVMERVREFGVLMAVGMKRRKVFLMIILETIVLSFFGGIVGIILASITVAYFGVAGIDLSAFAAGLSEFGMDAILYPILPIYFYASITIMILFTAVFSAVYPAIKAIRLKPATAIRTF